MGEITSDKTTLERQLISTLSTGEFCSGQALGELLGVSRTAVWKHLQKLGELGLNVESVKGLGYRIPGGLSLLDDTAIFADIEPESRSQLSRLEVHHKIDSTNAYLSNMGDAAAGVAVLAEYQIGGRGRRGRSWVSPYGKNIYLSLGWRFDDGASRLEGLSLAVGVAVCRALGAPQGLALKWPNDLLFEERKLAGILIEMQGDPNGSCQVIVGVGINQGMLQGFQGIDQPWADVTEFCDWTRNQLAARVISELVPVVGGFSQGGLEPFLEEWNRWDLCKDRDVRLITPGREITGTARGIAANGALVLERDGMQEQYSGGEISLRFQS